MISVYYDLYIFKLLSKWLSRSSQSQEQEIQWNTQFQIFVVVLIILKRSHINSSLQYAKTVGNCSIRLKPSSWRSLKRWPQEWTGSTPSPQPASSIRALTSVRSTAAASPSLDCTSTSKVTWYAHRGIYSKTKSLNVHCRLFWATGQKCCQADKNVVWWIKLECR